MPSPREEIADALVDTCVFGGLDESYGVNKQRGEANGKTFWSITFAKARTLDGLIRVYSPTFIQIKWQGSRAVASGLSFTGNEICRSEAAAKLFLTKHFINL
jgi:hypothetical protein